MVHAAVTPQAAVLHRVTDELRITVVAEDAPAISGEACAGQRPKKEFCHVCH